MTKRAGLEVNGVGVPDGPRLAPLHRPAPAAPPRARIFDHMDGCPEIRLFSRVARAMVAEPWWSGLPMPASGTQADESGEVRRETMLQITNVGFTACVVVGKRAAPIVAYMRDWSADRIREYCDKRGWLCQELVGG